MKSTVVARPIITGALTVLMTSSALAFYKPTNIYPFEPMSIDEIYSDVEKVSEDPNFIRNFNDIIKQGLSEGKPTQQPWTSSYWPLAKGTVADAYEDSVIPYYLDFARTYKFQWKGTASSFEKRKEKIHANIDSLTEEELSRLAPTEKYDLLLGDRSFDLTNKVMEYMERYGTNNYFEGLENIVLAPEKGSTNDSIEYAKKSMGWNGFHSIDEAFRKDFVLQRRLDVKMAIKLVDEGHYNNVVDAMEEALPKAQEEADNYVLDERIQDTIASWEGICNGWSTAAGLVPRPRRTVEFELPDGRNLIFYPSDIKGLISQFWFHSAIQGNAQYDNDGKLTGGGTILIGNRCNQRSVRTDSYGRRYDDREDVISGKLESRCAGVHPAKWHLGLVNLMGKQKRSFIVERKVQSAVDNHPMSGYKMSYFNPKNGRGYRTLDKLIEKIDRRDQFEELRHPDAVYIIGVETTMEYLNYKKPSRKDTNSEEDDSTVDKTMLYDLELDKDYNIIGGQWRAIKKGRPDLRSGPRHHQKTNEQKNYNQPDFFWVVSKQWKETGYFDNNPNVTGWDDTTKAPPAQYKEAAINGIDGEKYHNSEYHFSLFYGNANNCDVKNTVTGEELQAFCERKITKPQPFVNVLNVLIERAK